MNQAESDLESQVRRLHSAGLSTRKIAAVLGGVSQSTVSRALQKINSGPQPVLREESRTQERPAARWTTAAWVAGLLLLALMAVTFIVLTAAVATIAWR